MRRKARRMPAGREAVLENAPYPGFLAPNRQASAAPGSRPLRVSVRQHLALVMLCGDLRDARCKSACVLCKRWNVHRFGPAIGDVVEHIAVAYESNVTTASPVNHCGLPEWGRAALCLSVDLQSFLFHRRDRPLFQRIV